MKVVTLFVRAGRPRPLFRALALEKALQTPARLYYKGEFYSPTGSHKVNTALAQAYYAKEEVACQKGSYQGVDGGFQIQLPPHLSSLHAVF